MIETERAVAVQNTMIAEKPAAQIANDYIGILACALPRLAIENLVVAPETRAGAGDHQAFARDLGAPAIVKDNVGRARLVPWGRGGIDEVAHRVAGLGPQSQEKPGRKAGRAPGIGLRLAFVGQHGVEDMGAEARLGGVPARAVLITEQRVQPAIAVAALREIVDELHMPAILGQAARQDFIQVERHRVAALQASETMP